MALSSSELPGGAYELLVIGSGYGGAVTAARAAEAGRQVALLERGREWTPGEFPADADSLQAAQRSPANPLGLFCYDAGDDMDALTASGLGGGSLIGVGALERPASERLADPRWPAALRELAASGGLAAYFEQVERALGAAPHPRAASLAKFQALRPRADEVEGASLSPLSLSIQFEGGDRPACIDCGDCVTGCNVGAMNTLATNYLLRAHRAGAALFTGAEVDRVEPAPSSGWRVWYAPLTPAGRGSPRLVDARRVVLAAGVLGSTGILLRSREYGLSLSPRLGRGVSCGDFLGAAWNADRRTDALWFDDVRPGPSSVGAVRYPAGAVDDGPVSLQELGCPRALADAAWRWTPLVGPFGEDTDFSVSDELAELGRHARDLLGRSPEGALNSSLLYLARGLDEAGGEIALGPGETPQLRWPGAGDGRVFERLNQEIRAHARALGATFVQNPRWIRLGGRNLITAHPTGGCGMGDSVDEGVVDDRGRVFCGDGGVHEGLSAIDGSVLSAPLGVGPALTIAALAEWVADRLDRSG